MSNQNVNGQQAQSEAEEANLRRVAKASEDRERAYSELGTLAPNVVRANFEEPPLLALSSWVHHHHQAWIHRPRDDGNGGPLVRAGPSWLWRGVLFGGRRHSQWRTMDLGNDHSNG